MKLNGTVCSLINNVGSLNGFGTFRKDNCFNASSLILLSWLHYRRGNYITRFRMIFIDEISNLLVLFSLSDSGNVACCNLSLSSILLNYCLSYYLLGYINCMSNINWLDNFGIRVINNLNIDIFVLAVESSDRVDMNISLLASHYWNYLGAFECFLGICVDDLDQLSWDLGILHDLCCWNWSRDVRFRLNNIRNWDLNRLDFCSLPWFSRNRFVDNNTGSLGVVCEDCNCCCLTLSWYNHWIYLRDRDSGILFDEGIKNSLSLWINLSHSLDFVRNHYSLLFYFGFSVNERHDNNWDVWGGYLCDNIRGLVHPTHYFFLRS